MTKKGANSSYLGSVKEAVNTTAEGAKITLRHFKNAIFKNRKKAETANYKGYFTDDEGIVTLNYPHETIPVPDNGRYKLHNEMDDCIVCDKCAKVCPVDCIDIEPIKSPEVIGNTSDGTAKRLYAAKFDIDMAKCCYCGLCTTVCPTECLTMTKTYDFSEFDIQNMNYHFANITPEEAEEKRKAFEQVQAEKQKKALEKETSGVREEKEGVEKETSGQKPKFKPKARKALRKKPSDQESEKEEPENKKPAFRPKSTRALRKKDASTDEQPPKSDEQHPENPEEEKDKSKPIYKPKARKVIRKKPSEEGKPESGEAEGDKKTHGEKPKYRPKARPIKRVKRDSEEDKGDSETD